MNKLGQSNLTDDLLFFFYCAFIDIYKKFCLFPLAPFRFY